jgi:hypothetical protein
MQHTRHTRQVIVLAPSTCVDHNLETYLSQCVFSLQYIFLVLKNGNPPQLPHPAMTPKAITSALAAAQVLFLLINGQPSNDNLVRLSNAILPILLKAIYDHLNSVHNLWGLVASADRYLHHYGTLPTPNHPSGLL